jgi:Uri superfamily endonuclease
MQDIYYVYKKSTWFVSGCTERIGKFTSAPYKKRNQWEIDVRMSA